MVPGHKFIENQFWLCTQHMSGGLRPRMPIAEEYKHVSCKPVPYYYQNIAFFFFGGGGSQSGDEESRSVSR